MQKKTFSLLVFHGSARQGAIDAAAGFAQKLRIEAGCENFAVCYLRGVAPELHDAIAETINSGYQNIRLIPLFLLPGSHITIDIPEIVKKFSVTHPEVKFAIADCLVNDQLFLEFVANSIKN